MKLTRKMIEKHNPCKEGLDWYIEHGTDDLLSTLLKVNKVNSNWARWLFTNLMNRKQCIEIAIYSAKLVLPLFEKQCPDDNRPRLAIKAAELVLKRNTKANREKARLAAEAADNAVYDAAAYAAAYAAYAASSASYTACAASVYVAHAAAYSIAHATAAYNRILAIQEKIIRKAVKILERDKK